MWATFEHVAWTMIHGARTEAWSVLVASSSSPPHRNRVQEEGTDAAERPCLQPRHPKGSSKQASRNSDKVEKLTQTQNKTAFSQKAKVLKTSHVHETKVPLKNAGIV